MSWMTAAYPTNLARLAERFAMHRLFGNALGKPLSYHSDQELDRALSALGVTRADLFKVTTRNASHRRRMASLLTHFGVSPHFAVEQFWSLLRDADQACLQCRNKQRCINWLYWPVNNDAPRVFCPNAAVFDAIAFWQETLEIGEERHHTDRL